MFMKIHIITFGCSNNQAESEIMSGLLVKAGYSITNNIKNSDLVIVNTCLVKFPTENRVIKLIKNIIKNHPEKKLIIAGCMPEGDYKTTVSLFPKASLVSTHHITKIVEAVNKTLKRKRIEFLGLKKEIKLGLPRIRKNPVINIVPISSGCNSMCSYCCVRFVKGELFSYPINNIVNEVMQGVKQGCREIWITSQDNSCYGFDINTGLVNLLKEIVKIPGKFYVRIGMMNPKNVLKILPDLIKIYKNKKVFRFLHIPVQSGNDIILKKMNRKYNVKDFKKIINSFKKEIPNITVSTDIIVGFPAETENQFNDSLNLIKWLKPDVLNISRFWPRPETKASKMKNKIHGRITKQRSRILTKLFEKISFEKNKIWNNWKGDVLIDEKVKNGYIGRNICYKPVFAKKAKLGEFKKVKIKKIYKHYLEA